MAVDQFFLDMWAAAIAEGDEGAPPGTYVPATGASTIAGLKDFTTPPTTNGAGLVHLLGASEYVANKTSASSAWVNFDAAVQVPFTYSNRPIRVSLSVPYTYNDFATGFNIFAILIDGVEVGQAAMSSAAANLAVPVFFRRWVPNATVPLAVGAHVATVSWKRLLGGTMTVAGTLGALVLEVEEA